MKRIFTLILFLTGLLCQAQILKVDKGFLATDSSNFFTGAVDLSFAVNNRSSTADQENVFLGITNNLDVVYIAERSATVLISGLNYYKIGDGPLIYNGTAHLRQVLRRSAKVTPEFFGQVQFDESRNMVSRWLMGGGMRWNILQKRNSMYAGIGAFRENERWKGEQEIIKRLWKLNAYLSADVWLNETTNVNTIVYFQSGRDGAIEAYRHRLSGQLEVKNALTSRFKLKMSANFLVDDRPIIPLNEVIYEAFFGMEYVFN